MASKIGTNEDLVKAATNPLQKRLEQLSVDTAAECYQRWGEEDKMPPPRVPPSHWTLEGATIVGQQIEHWRERSLGFVAESFESLVALTPADAAKDLIWGVINEVFHWTEDRNNSTKFQQWLHAAGFSGPYKFDGLLPGLKGDSQQQSVPDQVNFDFRTSFESRLIELTNQKVAQLERRRIGPPQSYRFRSKLRNVVAYYLTTVDRDASDQKLLTFLRENHPKLIRPSWEEDEKLAGDTFTKVRKKLLRSGRQKRVNRHLPAIGRKAPSRK